MFAVDDSHFKIYIFLCLVDYLYFYTDVRCVFAERDDYKAMKNSFVPAEEIFLSILKNYYRIFAFIVCLFVK